MDRNDLYALALFTGCTGASLWLVPDAPLRHLHDPAYRAVLAGGVVLLAILLARFLGPRAPRVERGLLALLLAAMPLIYLEGCAQHGGRGLWIEGAGLAAFAGLAGLGLARSPWFLVGGIAAHGLLWDAWHHGPSACVQPWYPPLCMIVDVCCAAYAATQVRRWQTA